MIDRAAHVAVAPVAGLGAIFLVVGLHDREAVARQIHPRLDRLDTVEPGAVAAEDGGLHRAVRRTERRVAEFLLHVLGNLEPPEALDLPLRRTGPQGVGAPA